MVMLASREQLVSEELKICRRQRERKQQMFLQSGRKTSAVNGAKFEFKQLEPVEVGVAELLAPSPTKSVSTHGMDPCMSVLPLFFVPLAKGDEY